MIETHVINLEGGELARSPISQLFIEGRMGRDILSTLLPPPSLFHAFLMRIHEFYLSEM